MQNPKRFVAIESQICRGKTLKVKLTQRTTENKKLRVDGSHLCCLTTPDDALEYIYADSEFQWSQKFCFVNSFFFNEDVHQMAYFLKNIQNPSRHCQ